jgi:hypothetical protein
VDWNASKNGSVWSSGNGSDGYLENFTYSLWTNKAVTVSITTSDALSNVEYIEYYKTDSILTENQLRYDSTIQWSRGVNGLTSFTVAPDEKFIVYAHVVDKAGNETFVASDGIIVDETQPTMSEFSPRVIVSPQQPVNNIYNTDVTMDVYTFDPVTGNNSYSGFDSITYVVRNMGEETQSGTLYSFGKDEASFDELLQTWTGEFSVSSSLNNSNDVDIVITAVDNAGNVTVATSAVQIDITNPSIEVSYDNNSGDSSVGDTTYFNAERTATVSITERNFNSDDVEITVTNTDGVMPDISNWSTESGGGNGDEDVHTATIRYYADGDYTFDISFKDMVGNDAPEEDYGSSAAPTEFTIDMTNPVISVSYDYNDAANGNYYNQVRTATVTIEEHNFETSRINTTLSADGGEGGVPQISDWSTSGDTHTATVVYSGDTLYTFAMEYSDMAGNAAESIAAESFYVDVTKPQTSIDGISKFANAGEVAPVVTFQDTYYDSVEITLTGANTGEQVIDGKGSYSVGDTGGTFTFNNLDIDDDVYTLKVTATDKAGNVSDDDSVVFALNREGSVYVVDSDSNVNGKYLSSGQDIVIREINVNSLSAQKITLFKNDQTIVLTEGTDYSIAIEGSDEIGYTYIYTIFKKNFEDDGVYRISVYSEDAAGNVAENTIETKAKYEAEMSFAVDKTGPKIIMLNIESGKTYSTNRLEAQMSVNDNLKLSKVEVYLDGESNAVWNEADIKQLSGSGSDFMFYIDGGSTKAHTVQAVAEDAAGNKNQLDLEDIYVTTNIWIRYYTNKALFYGSIGGAATLSCASGGLVFFRRRRIKIHKLIK